MSGETKHRGDTDHRSDTKHRGVSKRFTPSRWTSRLMPVFIAILLIGLIATLAVVILSIMGVTPGF